MTAPRHSKNSNSCAACSPEDSLKKSPEEERAELRSLVQKIAELVQKDPRKAAMIVTEWVRSTPAQRPSPGSTQPIVPAKKKSA